MISLVSTVKAPKADLDRFVTYHLNTGVEHIYLFFDDPEDPSLPAFVGMDQITATACTPERWQAADIHLEQGIEARQQYNASEAMTWAHGRGSQWLLHIDSDELIHIPDSDLPVWLARLPASVDAVIFPVLEAIPHAAANQHPFNACRMFKTEPRPDPARLDLAAWLGCRQAFRYGYFRGHLIGKAATRVTANIDTVGIHFPTGASLQLEMATDAYVLHYDGCNFEAWRRKWARRKDRSGLPLIMRPDRRRQFDDFLIADEKGSSAELEREYRRQCQVPAYEQAVLWALGLARPIRLRRDLFSPRGNGIA